jgi:cysteine desulfurase
MAYLDHNASSPLRPEAKEAMRRAMEDGGNPSSVHAAGRAARALIEGARINVARLAGATPAEVVFTASGSEANALALWGGALSGAVGRLLVAAVEHDSVPANAHLTAERCGLKLDVLPVDAHGVIRLDVLKDRLVRSRSAGGARPLVAIQAAGNETGVIQPMDAILTLAHAHGALVFSDGVQAAGKADLPQADYLTLAAHKIGGPAGAGALIVRAAAPFAPLIGGGGQERGRRAGTENVVGIAGFGAAAAAAADDREAGRVTPVLRDRFEAGLRRLAADATIFGAGVPRLANTSFFAVPGMAAESALMALDLDGVCVSRGAACSAGKVGPSHVLAAMGAAPELVACALRLSLGWNSTAADVEAALSSLDGHLTRLKRRAA